MEWQNETIEHLRSHVEPMLPALGSEISAVCNMMEDVPEQDRDVIISRLTGEKNYDTLDDILADINEED